MTNDSQQQSGASLPASTCSLIYSAWLENWFVVAPHEGTGQPEGSGEEWREILTAMKERRRFSFRRIGVEFDASGNAWFWSPRNSMNHQAAEVPAAEVDAWIARAEKIVEAYSANAQISRLSEEAGGYTSEDSK